MSLLAWQIALAKLVTARAANQNVQVGSSEDLSAQESIWLETISSSAGLKLTCDVQRWWREFRVQQAAPLTLGALKLERRAELVDEYIRRHDRPSSFFLREALPFLDLVGELASDLPHIPALAAFERAMLRLGNALADDPAIAHVGACRDAIPVEVHPLADVITFQAPPGQVLAAASRGLPFPRTEDRSYWILIAPGLANLASGCTFAGARLFQAIRADGVFLPTVGDATFEWLWASGALRHTA